METYFSLGCYRSIDEAKDVTYNNGIVHPSRECPAFHDLIYMAKGQWEIFCCGEAYTVCEGDVIILPAGYPHTGKKACANGTRTLYIHIFPVSGDSNGEEEQPDDKTSRLQISNVVHCQNNAVVRSLFEEVILLEESDLPEKKDMQSVLVQSLFCMLNKSWKQSSLRNHDIVQICIDILNSTPEVIFKEKEMAQRLYISTKTLRAGFRRMYGKTFYQYQLDYKLSKVCSYLTNDADATLSEIAGNLGFCDEFHLSKLFKKKYGISPNQYRKRQ